MSNSSLLKNKLQRQYKLVLSLGKKSNFTRDDKQILYSNYERSRRRWSRNFIVNINRIEFYHTVKNRFSTRITRSRHRSTNDSAVNTKVESNFDDFATFGRLL